MSIKSKNKRIEISLMVVAVCFMLVCLLAVLATHETALAAKPGNIPVCIEFGAGGGIQSDDGPYCDDKQLKVEAIMTPDGHVNLLPNTGRGDGRIFKVFTNLDPENPLEGWRFLVGGWNESFDMRAMKVGDVRPDVNLIINTKAPDGNDWRLFFDPSYQRWGIDYSKSTYTTVTCTGEDEMGANKWLVENTDENVELSKAVLVVQTKVKNKSIFTYGGVVTVPPFTATVTLVP